MGNGDVFAPADAERMFAETRVDGVMIGRGVLSNPWLLRQCYDHLSGNPAAAVSLQDKAAFVLTFLDRIQREIPEPIALGKMKKMGGYLSKGIPGGARLREQLHSSRSSGEFLGVLRKFFAELLQQVPT
jgi:tRNA-dihydrouridine synthase